MSLWYSTLFKRIWITQLCVIKPIRLEVIDYRKSINQIITCFISSLWLEGCFFFVPKLVFITVLFSFSIKKYVCRHIHKGSSSCHYTVCCALETHISTINPNKPLIIALQELMLVPYNMLEPRTNWFPFI